MQTSNSLQKVRVSLLPSGPLGNQMLLSPRGNERLQIESIKRSLALKSQNNARGLLPLQSNERLGASYVDDGQHEGTDGHRKKKMPRILHETHSQNMQQVISNINNAKQHKFGRESQTPRAMMRNHGYLNGQKRAQFQKSIQLPMQTVSKHRLLTEVSIVDNGEANLLYDLGMDSHFESIDAGASIHDELSVHQQEVQVLAQRNKSNAFTTFNNKRIRKYSINTHLVSLKNQSYAKTARERDFGGVQASGSIISGIGPSQLRMGRNQNPQAEFAMQQAMQLGINIKDGKVKKSPQRQEIIGSKSVSQTQSIYRGYGSYNSQTTSQANNIVFHEHELAERLDDADIQNQLKNFIDEETKSVERGVIGLPSIGGFMSQKKKSQYYNPHIANNGGAAKAYATQSQFDGRDNASIQEHSKAFDSIDSTHSWQQREQHTDPFGSRSSVPGKRVNLPTISAGPSIGTSSIAQGATRSNASFKNIFKMTKVSFKSPSQHQTTVLHVSQQHKKKEDKHRTNKSSGQDLMDETVRNLHKQASLDADVDQDGLTSHQTSKPDLMRRIGDGLHQQVMHQMQDITKQWPATFQKSLTKINYEELEHRMSAYGFDPKRFLLQRDVEELEEILSNLIAQRQAGSNIIDQAIQEIAESADLLADPEKFAQFQKDIQNYIDRRSLQDVFSNAAKPAEEQHTCQISLRALGFLKGEHQSSKLSPNMHSSCTNHNISEEDQNLKYLQEYKRFLEFASQLHAKLKDTIPAHILIESLTREIGKLTLTPQEKKIFEGENAVEKLLANPLLKIGLSATERDKIKQEQQQARGKDVVSQESKVLGMKGKLILKKSTSAVLSQISMSVLQESIKNMMVGKGGFGKLGNLNALALSKAQKARLSKRESFVDIAKLIGETETKTALLRKVQEEEFGEEVDQKALDKADEIKLINSIELFRIKALKTAQKNRIKYSYRALNDQKQPVQKEELTEEELIEFEHELRAQDEALYDRGTKLVENFKHLHKQKVDQKVAALYFADNKQKEKAKTADLATNTDVSDDSDGEEEERVDILTEKVNLFSNIDAHMQFYQQAKQEGIGYHRPPNQESEFFHECKARGLLPQPLFKCINNNILKFQGKKLNQGYAMALAKFIEFNQKYEFHLLKLHLDDCSMKDQEFDAILKGVLKSKFGVSLQNITYSNNEMGTQSIQTITQFLAMGAVSSTRCLKELCFVNVNIKQPKDLRVLSAALATEGGMITKLKLQQINLNDSEIVEHICMFLRGNQTTTNFELSGCHLRASHLELIAKELYLGRNTLPLRALDLSGNAVSELIHENQIKQASFLYLLGEFLLHNQTLYSLNLSGLLLGKKLLCFLGYIQNSKSLIQVNLINNLLNEHDEAYIHDYLGIASRHQECGYLSLIEKYDMCYQLSLDKFKTKHLNAETSNGKNKLTAGGQQGIVTKIMNAGIVQQMRNNRNFSQQLQLNAKVGEVIAGTNSKAVEVTSSQPRSDRLFLRRFIGYNEFVFNELTEDNFGSFDVGKPSQWEVYRDLQSHEISENQYLMVFVDLDTIEAEFTQVVDAETIGILKTHYGLQALDRIAKQEEGDSSSASDSERVTERTEGGSREEFNRKAANYPLVFGTFSNWQAFQMLKPSQFAAILGCKSEHDRQYVLETIFNDEYLDVNNDFKSFLGTVQPLIESVIAAHSAHTVGAVPETFKSCAGDRLFIYAAYVVPGKHSIFVYNPRDDSFYQKVVAVDVQSQNFITRRFEAKDNKEGEKPASQEIAALPSLASKQLADQHTRDLQLQEAFVCDLKQGNFEIHSLIQDLGSKHLTSVLEALYANFADINVLHFEMMSECQDTYPYISFDFLKQFCENTGLVSGQKLDSVVHEVSEQDRGSFTSRDKVELQKKVPKEFSKLNRGLLLRFLVWACKNQDAGSELQDFHSFFVRRVKPLLKESKLAGHKKELAENEAIQELIKLNRNRIHIFLDKQGLLYGLTPQLMRDLVIKQAKIVISEYNVQKFYALSKALVVSEQAGKQDQYSNLKQEEFIEFIYRVASHIYDAKSYFGTDGTQLVPNVPDEVQQMFDEPMSSKFKKALQDVLNSDPTLRYPELIDESNKDACLAEADKLGGIFNAEMIQYLPNEQCVKRYLERVNKFKLDI